MRRDHTQVKLHSSSWPLKLDYGGYAAQDKDGTMAPYLFLLGKVRPLVLLNGTPFHNLQ